MSYKNMPFADRLRTELLEAAVEQGFALIDLAEEAALRGQNFEATQVLHDAERVLADIDQRLAQMQVAQSRPFIALIAELRRSLENARSHVE